MKRVRSFLISSTAWNLNEELERYFTNALISSDWKSPPTSKNMRFIIKKCRPTNPSNVFITIILKLENAMKPSGVPDHLFLNKRVFRINITFQVTLRTFFTNLKKKKYSKKKKKKWPKQSEENGIWPFWHSKVWENSWRITAF